MDAQKFTAVPKNTPGWKIGQILQILLQQEKWKTDMYTLIIQYI